ncbi:PQQ-binding-like beta-propeller repeat protein [Streptomyces fulvoviolaceus]|uniref:outer membrane protein assembly factor BamB family protein n=1 Tax=Streptomyces fulvoviolaceus TaxID=285535 RepID=UPI0004CB2C33|nr:PQQ-binding-like beta-propeller repeat protein [Streptomyces fulvoviolaceus]
MEELRPDDVRLLGPYVLLARLTPAGGEPRLLARSPGEEGLAEITLMRNGNSNGGRTNGNLRTNGNGKTNGTVRQSAAALRAATGPGFPDLLEDGSGAQPPWLAWRFVPSLTLAEAGALMYGGLPAGTVRSLAAGLAAPLARLHVAGYAHGGLAPDAILVAPDGPRLVRPRLKGSPQDDIAALGDLLTHAAAGRAPDDPLLRRCSHEDPEERPTARELVDELGDEPFQPPARLVAALARQADRALALESAADAPPPASPGRTSRRTLLTVGGAGLLLGGGAVAGWVAGRGGTAALTQPAASSRRTTPKPSAAPRGAPPAALWRYDAKYEFLHDNNAWLWHDVRPDGEKVVYLAEFPLLTALSMTDGRPVWQRGGIESRDPLLPGAPGTLILQRAGQLVAVDTDDGRQAWTKRVAGGNDIGVAELQATDERRGLLYYKANGPENIDENATPRTYLIAFDLRTRKERWRLRVPVAKSGQFLLLTGDNDLHVLFGMGGVMNLAEVDPRTGHMGAPFRHTWTVKGSSISASVASGQLYMVNSGRLTAAPLRSDEPVWEINLNDHDDRGSGTGVYVDTPQVFRIPGLGPVVYVTDANRTVYAIDPARGREVWRQTLLPDPAYGVKKAPGLSLTKSGRTLMTWGRGAGVVALDPRTGTFRWTFQNSQSASSIYAAYPVEDTALVVNGASVYALPAG